MSCTPSSRSRGRSVLAKPPEIILFDFFGVLCSEVAPFWLANNVPEADATALKGGLIHAADEGAIGQAEMFAELGRIAGKPADQVLAEWSALAVIDHAMVAFAAGLRARVRVSLLSNCPAPFLRELLRSHQLEVYFEQIIISSEVALAKPDPTIFHLALDRLGAAAASVLFIDDNPRNVVAAQSVGMRAIHFEAIDQCRDQVQVALLGKIDRTRC